MERPLRREVHGGCGERPGETGREQSRNRAPGPLDRAALPLSRQVLTFTSGLIRRHRKSIGSRWRKPNPGQEALLVLAYLRKGETFAELAGGFEVGTATAWRYVEETVWVPKMPSPHATCEYSWIRPPSRSRRRTRMLSSAGAAGIPASGGLWLRVRCGRWVL